MKAKKLYIIAALLLAACCYSCGEKEGSAPEFTYKKTDPRDDPDPVIKQIPTQVIAHRGFWKPSRVAENTVRALIKADELRVYGSEFDVHLTSDGVPVAGHDATVKIGGETVYINDCPWSKFQNKKLDNGESLPTLEEFLIAGKNDCKNGLKLIIEIKEQKVGAFNDLLVEKTVKMVKDMGMRDRVEYISFGANIVKKISGLDPEAKIAYLFQYTPMPGPAKLQELGASGLDSDFNKTSKEVIDNIRNSGYTMNVWTLVSKDDIRRFANYNVDYITTDDPEAAIEVIEAVKRGK